MYLVGDILVAYSKYSPFLLLYLDTHLVVVVTFLLLILNMHLVGDIFDCMMFISVYNQGTNLKINGSRNDIACFLHIIQASVTSRPPVFSIGDTKTYIFTLSKG